MSAAVSRWGAPRWGRDLKCCLFWTGGVLLCSVFPLFEVRSSFGFCHTNLDVLDARKPPPPKRGPLFLAELPCLFASARVRLCFFLSVASPRRWTLRRVIPLCISVSVPIYRTTCCVHSSLSETSPFVDFHSAPPTLWMARLRRRKQRRPPLHCPILPDLLIRSTRNLHRKHQLCLTPSKWLAALQSQKKVAQVRSPSNPFQSSASTLNPTSPTISCP